MRLRTILALTAMTLATAGPLDAHHSYADYEDRVVTIGGTLEQVAFANPHTVLTIRTQDAGVYTATWRTARQLERDGVTREHLKVGDVVTITGNPSRVRPDLSKLTEVRRIQDGWAWRMDDGRISVTASR
jgi:hypothetical protein